MKLKYNEIMEQACYKDNNLSLSVKKAFEEFLNEEKGVSKLLAKHVDQ